MKRVGQLFLFFLVTLAAAMFPGCENPFDPLDKSDEIRGLSYIDFSLTLERWGSDPRSFDGAVVSPEYFNEFGDSLSFHDKPHKVVTEFWTQGALLADTDPETGEPIAGSGIPTNGALIFSYPVEYAFADDEIRIPREAYEPALAAAGYDIAPTTDEEGNFVPNSPVNLFVIVRAFPPKADPRPMLFAFYPDQEVWKPAEAVVTPLPGEGGDVEARAR